MTQIEIMTIVPILVLLIVQVITLHYRLDKVTKEVTQKWESVWMETDRIKQETDTTIAAMKDYFPNFERVKILTRGRPRPLMQWEKFSDVLDVAFDQVRREDRIKQLVDEDKGVKK